MTTIESDTTHRTRDLARYLLDLRFPDIPASVVEMTKLYTLECLGHMVSAHEQRVSQLVMAYLRTLAAAPQSIVVCSTLRTSPAEAAYANGTLAHADELESHGTLPGTGLVPPIAAAISVGDFVSGTSGQAFLAAVVAGVEMQGRLGTAANRSLRPRLHGHLTGGSRGRGGDRRAVARARSRSDALLPRHRTATGER
jgi:2-methylcitrate dehydratase PrpD